MAVPALGRREPCAKCGHPVFLAERLNVDNHLYHRTCFRCARCDHQLSLANYYETEDSQYCCETCPDEDPPALSPKTIDITPTTSLPSAINSLLIRSLSDDEKEKTIVAPSKLIEARNNFIITQLETNIGQLDLDQCDSGALLDDNEVPEISKVLPPDKNNETEEITEPGTSLTISGEDSDRDDTDLVHSSISTSVKSSSDNNIIQPPLLATAALAECVTKEEANSVTIPDDNSMVTRESTECVVPAEEETVVVPSPVIELQSSMEDVTVRSHNYSNSDEHVDLSCTSNKSQLKGTDKQDTSYAYPKEYNPFDDDEDEDTENPADKKKESTNPFGSDDEDETVSLNQTKVSLNPFGSDEEFSSDDNVSTVQKPVPKPRSILPEFKTPEPSPRNTKNNINNSDFRGSATSLESSLSGKSTQTPTGTYRKKKPAPPPPTAKELFPGSENTTPLKRTPLRPRKNRPAPPPPILNTIESSMEIEQPVCETKNESLIAQISPTKSTNSSITSEPEREKNDKDEKNRNRQSLSLSSAKSVISQSSSPTESEPISLTLSPPNKSTYGKWKRKKGPAPPRPLPQRRQTRVISADELRQQLDVIEIQQQGLEKQGVKLEQMIREKCEIPGNEETSIAPDVEDLVMQLFELVNEKNELFRKQAELMYLRRQQRLEEEYADLEYQIRCLMERPESNKTDFDKAREEELLARLVEVVEIRNEIVECLEMDRIREAEEDESIHAHMHQFTLKRDSELKKDESDDRSLTSIDSTKLSKKEKKKQKKIKKTKGVTIDVDKDVDETESIEGKKEKKRRKWFI